MIEIIYKGEEEALNDEINIRLPKNIRQIGECEHYSHKIYVEDFVMTYVKHFSSQKLKYGVLLGDIKRGNGNTYIFITGAVTANAILDNEILFDEDVWTGIYEEIKMYFEEVEIVGWFASMPSLLPNDMPNIQKLHIDNFAGNDRVCFLLDREEGDENFFLYDEGGMKKCEGFYIYYEKNADMQSYMSMHVDTRIVPDNYEQIKKRGINARVHDLLFNSNDSGEKDTGKEQKDIPLVQFGPQNETRDHDISLENISAEDSETKKGFGFGRRLPTFAYSASSLMLIAILVGTIAIMNASGQLKELKSAVVGLVGKEDSKPKDIISDDNNQSANIVDVVGNVSESRKDGETSAQETSPQKTEPGTETKESETTKSEETFSTEPEQQTEPDTSEAGTVSQQVTEPPAEPATEPPTEAPTATVSGVQQDKVYYVVKKGDSLYSISMKNYGNYSMIQSIMQANGITNENFIREGETIILP